MLYWSVIRAVIAVSVLYQLCQLQMSILRRDSEEQQMVGAEVNGDCKTQQKSLDTISGNKIETSQSNKTQISSNITISAQGDVSCVKPSVWRRGGGGHRRCSHGSPWPHGSGSVSPASTRSPLPPPPPLQTSGTHRPVSYVWRDLFKFLLRKDT